MCIAVLIYLSSLPWWSFLFLLSIYTCQPRCQTNEFELQMKSNSFVFPMLGQLLFSHTHYSVLFQITLVLLGSGFLLQVSIPTIEGASKLQKLAFSSILHNTCGKLVLNIDWWLWIWRIYSLTSTAHQILFLICPQQVLWPFFNLDLNVVLCKLGQSKAKAK